MLSIDPLLDRHYSLATSGSGGSIPISVSVGPQDTAMSQNAPPLRVSIAGTLGITTEAGGSSSLPHNSQLIESRAMSGLEKMKRTTSKDGRQPKVIVVIDASSPQAYSVLESLAKYNEEEKQRERNITAQELLNPAPPFETSSSEQDLKVVPSQQNDTPSSTSSSLPSDDGKLGRSFTKSNTSRAPSIHSRRYSDHLPPSLTSPIVKPMISNVPNDFSTTTVHIDSDGVVHPVGVRSITMMNLESKTFHRIEDEKAKRLEERDRASPRVKGNKSLGLNAIAEAGGSNDVFDDDDKDFEVAGSDFRYQDVSTMPLPEEVISSREARAQALYTEVEDLVEKRFIVPWKLYAIWDGEVQRVSHPTCKGSQNFPFSHWVHSVKVDLDQPEQLKETLEAIKKANPEGIAGIFASHSSTAEGLPRQCHDGKRMKMVFDVAKEVGVDHFIASLLADFAKENDSDDDSRPVFTEGLPEMLERSRSDQNYIRANVSSPSSIKYTTTFSSYLTFSSILSSSILSFQRPSLSEKLFELSSHLPLDSLVPFSHARDVGPAALLAFLDPEEYNGKNLSLLSDLISPRLMAAQCDQIIYHLRARVKCRRKEESSFHKEDQLWFDCHGWKHVWELFNWWIERAKSVSETILRKKTAWRLTAWRHYVVENQNSTLKGWQQFLPMVPNHLDPSREEAPTRFDRPFLQQDHLDVLMTLNEVPGPLFFSENRPVGKIRNAYEGEGGEGGGEDDRDDDRDGGGGGGGEVRKIDVRTRAEDRGGGKILRM